jgi:hypothetical protein
VLKTYTFYLRDSSGDVRFEPVLCQSDLDAMARARSVLNQTPDCAEIEAYFGDERLFGVSREPGGWTA